MAPSGKHLLDRLFIPAVIVLVGVAAFGLGRLSAFQELENGFVVHPAPEVGGE